MFIIKADNEDLIEMCKSLGLGNNNNNNNNKYTFSDSDVLVKIVNHLEIAEQELNAIEKPLVENEAVPFEEVIFNDKILDENETLTQEGPKLVKTMGDNRGLSNSVSLALFLAIDVVAIFVGLFLLMH